MKCHWGDDGDRELLLALESEAEGFTHREVAIRLWGAGRVAEEWWPGSWMAARVKRRFASARRILRQYRNMATGKQAAPERTKRRKENG